MGKRVVLRDKRYWRDIVGVDAAAKALRNSSPSFSRYQSNLLRLCIQCPGGHMHLEE